MKTIATTLAIAALALLGAAPQADARPHRSSHSSHSSRVYISGHRACGTPIYTERYFIGYDRCGNPVWGERLVRQNYRPVVRHPAPCPQPYDSRPYQSSCREQPHRSGGIVIQGYFGR